MKITTPTTLPTTLGKVEGFESTKRMFAIRRAVEQFFDANGIDSEKKCAVLLSVIGPTMYNVLWNLTSVGK